ncbi:MAG: hypothetical protein IPJ79_07960 [Bacteroidetes bacterium]|nr:hypothetical protein [Bacteroidota bacterium]
MPGKNGYELSAAIRGLADKKKSATPIFALTAYETATESIKPRMQALLNFYQNLLTQTNYLDW